MSQGKPIYAAPRQRAAIASYAGLELLEPPRKVALREGKLRLSFTLPAHGVSLLSISPAAA